MEAKPQRLAGSFLGVWLAVHQLLLPSTGGLSALILGILSIGLVLRLRDCLLPDWVTWIGLAGVVLPIMSGGSSLVGVTGSVAAWVGAILLLGPLTAARGMWVVLCALLVLAVITIGSSENIPIYLLICDVGILMLLTQQAHAPAGSRGGFLLHSLRLVIPVAIIVTAAFWFFPTLSSRTNAALTGFSTGLNPSDFSGLQQSRKVAFVATFPENGLIPKAGDLYWRAESLSQNDGLRWSRDLSRKSSWNRNPTSPSLEYELSIRPKSPIAPLDLPVTDEAGGLVQTVLDEEGSLDNSLVRVQSSLTPAKDLPLVNASGGDLAIPAEVAENIKLKALSARLFQEAGVPERLAALGEFLQTGGFVYTTRPGRIRGVGELLLTQRRGFCEHYAAAAANLLRLSGVPTRIVSGYRGGQWNPWLRTMTIRDFHAHAWLEAWDAEKGQWHRFDPTSFVAPSLTLQIARERDPSQWPWHRLVSTFIASKFLAAGDFIQRILALPGVATPLAILLILFAVWFVLRGRKSSPPAEAALAQLNKIASRQGLPRHPGETPLAWMARLQKALPNAADREVLSAFSQSYESFVYSAHGQEKENHEKFLGAVGLLRGIRGTPRAVFANASEREGNCSQP